MIRNLFSQTRERLAKRREYNRLVDEINSLTARDLADINGSRAEMLYHVRRQIYG